LAFYSAMKELNELSPRFDGHSSVDDMGSSSDGPDSMFNKGAQSSLGKHLGGVNHNKSGNRV
jgi:hypothetical protein